MDPEGGSPSRGSQATVRSGDKGGPACYRSEWLISRKEVAPWMQYRTWVLTPFEDRATENVDPGGAPSTPLAKGDFLGCNSSGFAFFFPHDFRLAAVQTGSVPHRRHGAEPRRTQASTGPSRWWFRGECMGDRHHGRPSQRGCGRHRS